MELVIHNRIIDCDVEEILDKLALQCEGKYLQRMNRKSDFVQIACPFHKDGQERKPSCSVYNRHDNPEVVFGTYHCFTADTLIPTNYGLKPIQELIDKDSVEVTNGDGNREITTFKYYGDAPIYKLVLSRENKYKEICTTAEHQWFVKNSNKLFFTKDLKPGQYLKSQYSKVDDFKLDYNGVIHGIIYADGTRVHDYSRPRLRVNGKCTNKRVADKDKGPISVHYRVNFSHLTDKPKLVKYFESNPNWSIREDLIIDNKSYTSVSSHKFPIEHNFKSVPDISQGRDYVLSFLAGYFVCDGSIKGKSFSCVNEQDIKKIRDLFIACGACVRDVKKIIRDPGKTYLSDSQSVIYTVPIILESLPDMFFLLTKPCLSNKKYIRGRWKVERVEKTDQIKPVYCCQTSTESFVIDENILTHNCFTCNSTGPLWKLVAKVLNITYEDAQYWLIENFSNVFEDRRPILESFEEIDIPKTYLDESILEEYSYLHPYQFQRGLTEEVIKRFKVGWNPKTDSITFPVWDDKNNLVGITERHTKSKRFYIPSDMDKPIYLLNYIKQHNITEVVVCESQINTLTCWSWGIPAIGLIGTGSTKQYDILKKSGIRVYHLALDGDLAGEHGTQRFIKNMPSNVMIDIIQIPQGKDVNDLTKEEFLNLQRIMP